MTKYYNKQEQKSVRKHLRKNCTYAENLLWQRLKSKRMCGYKFRRQYSVGSYIIDFYCPKLKLAVEIDGSIHDSPDAHEYDRYRQKYLEGFNITFVRFRNRDVILRMRKVLESLTVCIKDLERFLAIPENNLPLCPPP